MHDHSKVSKAFWKSSDSVVISVVSVRNDHYLKKKPKKHITPILLLSNMVPVFSYYPSGTILIRAKAICLKRMHRLISIGVKTVQFIHNYTWTLSAFPCGGTQHVRRMCSSTVSMIQSIIEFRFRCAIADSCLNG